MAQTIRSSQLDELRELIKSQLGELNIPSLAVAVGKDQEIVWAEAFGEANREAHIPATPETVYCLGSVSKPVTATALMILRDRGLIDLDEPANTYLGEAKLIARIGNPKDATVRRLLNHTSGLPSHYRFFYRDELEKKLPVEETIRRYGNLVYPPGRRQEYSNLAFAVLGHIIERLSGKSYTEFLFDEIFLPLRITYSSVAPSSHREKLQATRYLTDGTPIFFAGSDHPPAGDVQCNIHDLVRFGMFHVKAHLADQEAILSDETLEEMRTQTQDIQIGNRTEGLFYRYGWDVMEGKYGYLSQEHSGATDGERANLVLFPTEKLVVALLSNSWTEFPEKVTHEILLKLLPRYAEKFRGTAETEPEKETATAFRPLPEFIGIWKGRIHTFEGDRPFSLDFREDGATRARICDQPETLVNEQTIIPGSEIFENIPHFSGLLLGDLDTEDTSYFPSQQLRLKLNLRQDVLNGVVTAFPNPGPGPWRDRPWRCNELSFWAELSRQ